jgi:hypothetical protein
VGIAHPTKLIHLKDIKKQKSHLKAGFFIVKFLAISKNVLLNVGDQALPDLQAKLALQNICKLIATHLYFEMVAYKPKFVFQ